MTDTPNDVGYQGVRAGLRRALAGGSDRPLVFLGNFEVEEQWAIGETGLPRIGGSGRSIVNRMDEFALLLGGAGDVVLLKSAPDPDYLAHLTRLGISLPTVLTPAGQDPELMVTSDVVADPALLAELGRLGAAGALLVPHGVSALEEELSRLSGLPLATPSAAVCKAVNSKVYSRKLADELGLRQAPGRTCETVAELADAAEWARSVLATGARVVIKDAFGVSGKGVSVVDDAKRLDRLVRMITAGARRAGSDTVAVLIEEWVAKTTDLNYQLTVDRDGTPTFDFVKEAVTHNGVHKGHRFPARLTAHQHDIIVEAATALGKHLGADGYHGVAGVDAMLDPDGGVYPIVEINARNNMSTYQAAVADQLVGRDSRAWARHYALRLNRPLAFAELDTALGSCRYDPDTGAGFVVNNFATVNAAAGGPTTFDGRLYGLLIAGSDGAIEDLDRAVADRLATVSEERPQ